MTEPSVLAELHYRDPDAALDWLARAFGFETRMVVRDPQGALVFAETAWGGHSIAIVPELAPHALSPLTAGASSATIQVRSDEDIDAHFVRARDAGATILSEPETLFFGDRIYLAADLEGHVWNFGRRGKGGAPPEGWTVRFPSREKG